MSEVKKCPKCGGEMKKSRYLVGRIDPICDIGLRVEDGQWGLGIMVLPVYCLNCGFIEIYKRMKKKKE
ncbi:MAG: hypothetical protein OEY22_05335 [Candidatus Bathyarchaeota archaeon]|nr:hypothetical protein [Candidatus Bathyarchaeota archaeon]MDH5788503.1 hypothetical protein [Candidatus Bathyarchaeota archaeon]